jgi:hypothetical protein
VALVFMVSLLFVDYSSFSGGGGYSPAVPEEQWKTYPIIKFDLEQGYHQVGSVSTSDWGRWRIKIYPDPPADE